MDIFQNPNCIKNLQKLLNPDDQHSSDEDDDISLNNKANIRRFGPGDIGHIKNSEKSSIKPKKFEIAEKKKEEEKSIIPNTDDDLSEIEKWLENQQKEDNEILESRKRPEYKISYKQAIGTEDVYLHMNNRSPASMSCEDMVIDIYMTEETVNVDQMNLKITDNDIDLQSPIYRLKLNLMHKIDPDKGQAKFDSDSKILKLTLRIKRELDFINF